MALSSDEIIKREIADTVGERENVKIRIFPQSSRDDQDPFSKGGLTFGLDGVSYGSCDACWFVEEEWVDGLDGSKINQKPIIALEGTDALNRKSSGNAQYQRFHHALGAVKNGVVGIYYLKKGQDKIQPDLFGMAFYASKVEKGKYLIIDDLSVVNRLLDSYGTPKFEEEINDQLDIMFNIFNDKFQKAYKGDWSLFAERRSTIIKKDFIIKYAGRMARNFFDASQRAGHIATGEMFLTKYYFYNKKFYYLFLKMTQEDLLNLDSSKRVDKEWFLLRHEPNVEIKTIDDLLGLNDKTKKKLISIKDEPLKGEVLKIYNECVKDIVEGLNTEKIKLRI
jgi:hypothetical protein